VFVVDVLSSMTAAKKRDGLTFVGFCHLLDAVESEIEHSAARKPHPCYVEDSSELPTGVYQEIVELVLSKN